MIDNVKCPCCGDLSLIHEGAYEICSVCKWMDDAVQRDDHDYIGGANKISLNQYKEKWEASLILIRMETKHSDMKDDIAALRQLLPAIFSQPARN